MQPIILPQHVEHIHDIGHTISTYNITSPSVICSTNTTRSSTTLLVEQNQSTYTLQNQSLSTEHLYETSNVSNTFPTKSNTPTHHVILAPEARSPESANNLKLKSTQTKDNKSTFLSKIHYKFL